MTLYEISFVFEGDRDVAERLLVELSDAVCAATGGSGTRTDHVCGGFVSAGLTELASD